jgi:hypothetical protein
VLLRQFGRYVPLFLFLLSLAKPVAEPDVAVILNTIASFLTCEQPGVTFQGTFTSFG